MLVEASQGKTRAAGQQQAEQEIVEKDTCRKRGEYRAAKQVKHQRRGGDANEQGHDSAASDVSEYGAIEA